MDHTFWHDDDNIKIFVLFVKMSIKFEYVLPYHFHPILLEMISHTKMTYDELEFFMEKIDPISVGYLKNISPEKFISLDLGYDTPEEYYRYRLEEAMTKQKLDVYHKISKYFDYLNNDIKATDTSISGLYGITPDLIISMTVIDSEYKNKWDDFIRSLTEPELKQIMIALSNSLSPNNKYKIYVSDSLKVDFQISTCGMSITIHKNLFDQIDNLRIYLQGIDRISDSIRMVDDFQLPGVFMVNNWFMMSNPWPWIIRYST